MGSSISNLWYYKFMHKRDTFQITWPTIHTILRLGMALAIITAVVWQLAYSSTAVPTFRPWNFFSFFTIQSNLIAAVVLLWAVLARREGTWLTVARGAATLYMTVTGVVFALLLANIEVGLTLPGVDVVLHKIVPVAMVLDWLIAPPLHKLTLRQVAWWFVYPIAWLIYTLLRGPLVSVQWYPYPFLDPSYDGGYGRVGLYVVGILVFSAAISALLAWLVRRPSSPSAR